ncbi:MAG: hypothetical protein DI556_07320 [Rhodovulum sulfidophilum]|uniref:Uncharacterized protein n=1 Tax=Rhodovulum sulfidophilum TaxID=35806 RepID=A0A2W5NA40_RHOSU|nr:MAG: hypothetical protein DI556_07320 [Rhodovulum sulfidophilum]
MAFEDFRMGLAMLLDEIAKNPDNKHELQESLREKLTEMRDLGLPLPEDLVELEDYLESDLDEEEDETATKPSDEG